MAKRPARASQKERINRIRAEKAAGEEKRAAPAAESAESADDAEPAAKPKTTKKAAATPAKRAPRAPKAPPKRVMVWAVVDANALKPVATFPYRDKAKAEAHCAKLTRDKKKDFIVQQLKQTVD